MYDDTYQRRSPVERQINVHPRDWLEQFGLEEPARYKYKMPRTNQEIKYELYPDYCPYNGWRWISKSTKERKQQRQMYESL
jgi:hypothetical protein